jgi:multidrug efflux pump
MDNRSAFSPEQKTAMAYKTDDEHTRTTHNAARYFVEHREIAWILLLAVAALGIYAYRNMPQRKDPEITVRIAVAVCPYPGATAQQVEQLVTRPIEDTIAQNKTIHPPGASDVGIRSISLPGISFVYVQLADGTRNTGTEFNDINLKLGALSQHLPQGAGPIQLQSDFGDTAALMLTVASPPADDLEVGLRAQSIVRELASVDSANQLHSGQRVSIVVAYPLSLSRASAQGLTENFRRFAEERGLLKKSTIVSGSGFIALSGETDASDAQIQKFLNLYLSTRVQQSDIPPDVWPPFMVRDLRQVGERLKAVAGAKYSYADLDNYTDLISRTLLRVPQTSKIDRRGVLEQAVYLDYSQEKLAASGFQPAKIRDILGARNITLPGGAIQAGSGSIILDPSGQFQNAQEIGSVIVSKSESGDPVYLRDLVQISQGYRSPPQYLNYYTWADKNGEWHRSRAITLAIYMRPGEQIGEFGRNVDEELAQLRRLLPQDLVIARTSDQPLQVRESIDLFMEALYEAIVLVVLVALIGFWEWRSAVLMALSIPITLAMTFGIAYAARIDLQQVSIATIIIALGLLVDDPVVANDAIKRELAADKSRQLAAWLGPTKLARAILYATATNIIAYLPFLLLRGTTGEFLYSLPIVMTAALVASRITSMTFVPMLGYYLLRPSAKPEPREEKAEHRGFYGFYYRVAGFAIEHRRVVFAGSVAFLLIGVVAALTLRSQFFPDDVQYWSYVDVWMPNNTPVSVTNDTALRAEGIIRRVVNEYENKHGMESKPAGGGRVGLLRSLNSFIGGGGPRFWFSVSPEQQQPNYAQVIIQLSDKQATPEIIKPLQEALTREIAGANLIVHQLQTNPVEVPVQVRVFGLSDVDTADETQSNEMLRNIAGRAQGILQNTPGVAVVQDNWFAESPEVRLHVDPDRANMAGITNSDVAYSAMGGISGYPVTTLRAGNKEIPVVARLHPDERAGLTDVERLYVYSTQGEQRVPLLSVASIQDTLETQRIVRQEHFRMISVDCYPQPNVLASEVLKRAMPALEELDRSLPPGYRIQSSGEKAKQDAGFVDLVVVLIISLVGIYFTLLLQFSNSIKPVLVFAATPYGVVGALLLLALTNTPFGFMAFLGIVSLIGVIVSHVIVLFESIEELREQGQPLDKALKEAGVTRLRPVLITVGATVLALFPLARHGGPLWRPLCYAQIGGLLVATFVTLLLVPSLYTIFVRDLKVFTWEP